MEKPSFDLTTIEAASIDLLLQQARERRSRLRLYAHPAAAKPYASLIMEGGTINCSSYNLETGEQLAEMLVGQLGLPPAEAIWDAQAIKLFILQLVSLERNFYFEADFRKTSGTVFKVEALVTVLGQPYAAKRHNNAMKAFSAVLAVISQ